MLSVVIPYHNEGKEFIETTINSIKATIDVEPYEIIVVDDGSNIPLTIEKERVEVIRHEKNSGVGSAFDTGVKVAKFDRLFLIGSDIRFDQPWASKIIELIDKNPKSLICTTCIGINKDNMDISKRRNISRRNGATILMFHDHISHPKKDPSFRNIIEAQWLPFNKDKTGIWEIPCILGAAYGVSKKWYEYIDGFAGHKSWGTLEPYISLKSWLFGGSCLTTTGVETGHIFKPSGTHGTALHHLIYNKIFVSTVLFDDYNRDRLINYLGTNNQIEQAKKEYNNDLEFIKFKREEYKSKIVIDPIEFFKRLSIDFRLDNV